MSNSFVTSRTVACQAPLSMGNPELEPTTPVAPALAGRFFATWKALQILSSYTFLVHALELNFHIFKHQ